LSICGFTFSRSVSSRCSGIALTFDRFCYKYEGESLAEIAPELKDGEKIHYVISHDECCVHANDQVNLEWMREGEQPLRNKSRGRIVHISDFILEHSGRLCLTDTEIAAQLLLPKEPLPPVTTGATTATVGNTELVPSTPATAVTVPSAAVTTPAESLISPDQAPAPAKKTRGKGKKPQEAVCF
jgi:hypothetical protein